MKQQILSLKNKIIPVGLEFSHYSRFRQVLTVAYGKPIEVSEFNDLYKESPERALNELRTRLSDEIKGIWSISNLKKIMKQWMNSEI